MEKREMRNRYVRSICGVLCFSLYIVLYAGGAANAAGTSSVTSAFNVVYEILAAIVSSLGQIYLLWGVFEWATSLNSSDGTMQSMAFKRIAAGLVACLAPVLIPVIQAAIG